MNAILTVLANGSLLSGPVAAAVWVALRMGLGRRMNAATRYVIWWATLAVVLMLPLLYLPSRGAPARPGAANPPGRELAPATAATAGRAAPMLKPAARQPPSSRPGVETPVILRGRWSTLPAPRQVRIEIGWTRLLLGAWMVAALFLLARLAAGWLVLARTARRAADVPPDLRTRGTRWMAMAGSRRRVRVAASGDIETPVAIGPLRPAILIPATLLERLDAAEIDQIGVHEAAHLARWDDCALLVQRLVEAVFALHPVVRWIARRIDLEREIACDDRVIASLGKPHSYAACLTRVVEFAGDGRSLAAAAAADDRSHLSLRIDMLLDRTRHTGTRLLKHRLALMLAVLAGLALSASFSPEIVAFAAPLIKAVLPAPVRQLAPPALFLSPQAESVAHGFRGRVLEDSTGAPLASAELRFHKAGWRELAADLETARDGRVSAIGLDPGDYTVDVTKPSFVTAILNVRLPDDDFLVRLVRYGVISGEVRNTEGKVPPGRVLDHGFAIGSTRICLLAKSPATGGLRLVTDVSPEPDGRFRIHDIAPGEYSVGLYYYGVPDGSGVQIYPDTAHPRFFTFAGGEDYQDVNFTIVPGNAYSVSGRVTPPTSDGGYALALALPEQPALPIAKTTTDKGGAFHFEHIPPGAYELFVAGPTSGYGMYDSTLAPNPLYARTGVQVGARDVEGIEISAVPGKDLSLTLGGQGNNPPPQGCSQSAGVRAILLEPWGIILNNQNFTRVSLGKESVLSGLPPGRYRLEASDLGTNCYQAEQPVADLTGGSSATVAIDLAAAGSLQGVLKPLPVSATRYIVVLLDAETSADAPTRLASVDAQGAFRIDGLRPGRYRIAAQFATDTPKTRWVGDFGRMAEIEIRGGQILDLELPITAREGAR